jgi:type 1 glutamine amidotransferase
VAAVRQLGERHGFEVEHTEDPGVFRDAELERFRVVVFLNTTGDVLDRDQELAFKRFVQAGGGFVGVHSAADTEYDWEWYGRLVGAYFESHPHIQEATIRRADPDHLSMRCAPDPWVRVDEWYNYRSQPVPGARVLATLDETSYEGGTMGDPHPIAWYHYFDGGRAWYTGLGHTPESYAEPEFLDHLAGGILWAAGDTPIGFRPGTARAPRGAR